MKENNKEYPSAGYIDQVADKVAQFKKLANDQPETARNEARQTLERMGVTKNGETKSQIVSWS